MQLSEGASQIWCDVFTVHASVVCAGCLLLVAAEQCSIIEV